MNINQKAPGPIPADQGLNNNSHSNNTKHPYKYQRVLCYLVNGYSVNLFEAAQRLHDRSLHSTISKIHNEMGIPVFRRTEKVPGYLGMPTHVCRYQIEDVERIRAEQKLAVDLIRTGIAKDVDHALKLIRKGL